MEIHYYGSGRCIWAQLDFFSSIIRTKIGGNMSFYCGNGIPIALSGALRLVILITASLVCDCVWEISKNEEIKLNKTPTVIRGC